MTFICCEWVREGLGKGLDDYECWNCGEDDEGEGVGAGEGENQTGYAGCEVLKYHS